LHHLNSRRKRLVHDAFPATFAVRLPAVNLSMSMPFNSIAIRRLILSQSREARANTENPGADKNPHSNLGTPVRMYCLILTVGRPSRRCIASALSGAARCWSYSCLPLLIRPADKSCVGRITRIRHPRSEEGYQILLFKNTMTLLVRHRTCCARQLHVAGYMRQGS
jgi:hypothetical protein